MKVDKRKYKIRKGEWNEVHKMYFNKPYILEYKKKTFVILSGKSDNISVLYYDKNTMVVLSTNNSLGYAGMELINFTQESSKTPPLVQSVFFQDLSELKLKKDFFDYSINTQADILAQYIY